MTKCTMHITTENMGTICTLEPERHAPIDYAAKCTYILLGDLWGHIAQENLFLLHEQDLRLCPAKIKLKNDEFIRNPTCLLNVRHRHMLTPDRH